MSEERTKFYVVYSFPTGRGSIEMTSDSSVLNYGLIKQFRDWISKEACEGANIVVENIIKLES